MIGTHADSSQPTAIPRWVYRFSSEHRSQAAPGGVSTWMGDRLGTPHVVGIHYFFVFFFNNFFFLSVEIFFFLMSRVGLRYRQRKTSGTLERLYGLPGADGDYWIIFSHGGT